MRIIAAAGKLTERGITNIIFNQLRNLLYCSFLLAIGVSALRSSPGVSAIGFPEGAVGVGCIVLAVVLTLLNLADGIYRLSRFTHSLIVGSVLIILYVLVAYRVTILAFEFRVGTG